MDNRLYKSIFVNYGNKMIFGLTSAVNLGTLWEITVKERYLCVSEFSNVLF